MAPTGGKKMPPPIAVWGKGKPIYQHASAVFNGKIWVIGGRFITIVVVLRT